MTESISLPPARPGIGFDFSVWAVEISLRPLQALMIAPALLFLAMLTTMLLRHQNVPFYEIDRVAFGLVVHEGGSAGSNSGSATSSFTISNFRGL